MICEEKSPFTCAEKGGTGTLSASASGKHFTSKLHICCLH
ncbi:hypothetical protein LEMLEM_LOCUS5542 [Lemmus lemmus]